MLHRRKIGDTLRHEGWDARSRVAGTVEVRRPTSSSADFRDRLVARVQSLGYEPTIVAERDSDGNPCIIFHTSETLAQSGQGGHGFGSGT
jgi:hypothetical protein